MASQTLQTYRALDYMTREAVVCLPQIIAAAGLQKIILLGHSDGASIAAIYAGSVEDHRVRGLILMAPHFFTEAMGLTSIADAKVAYENTNLAARMSKYHKNPDNTFYGWNDSWLHTDFKNWNITDVIDYIRSPVLAIQGREDQYGTTARLKLWKPNYMPPDIELLEDFKHSPFGAARSDIGFHKQFLRKTARDRNCAVPHPIKPQKL